MMGFGDGELVNFGMRNEPEISEKGTPVDRDDTEQQ
jgi:hypothetical protein